VYLIGAKTKWHKNDHMRFMRSFTNSWISGEKVWMHLSHHQSSLIAPDPK